MDRLVIRSLLYLILVIPLTTVTIHAQSIASDAAYARGVELYQMRKYAEAIPFFQKADSLEVPYLLEGNSAAEYPAIWLANCYYVQGDTARAREAYPNAYMLPPVDRRLVQESDALCNEAMDCMQAGDYESALRLLEQGGAIESRILGEGHYFFGNTLSLQATCLSMLERYEEALTTFEHAISIFSNYDFPYGLAESYIYMAEVYIAMDSLECAFESFNKALPLLEELDPALAVADLWADAGAFYANYCYDFYTSLDFYQRCFEIVDTPAPHDGIFYADVCNALGTVLCNIANILTKQKASTQALEAYREAFTYCSRADSIYRVLEETDLFCFAENLYLLALSGCKTEQPGHQALVREAAYLWQSEKMEPFSNTATAYRAMRLYELCNPDALTLEVAVDGLYSMAHELFEQEDVDMQVLGLDMLMDILTFFQNQGDHQQQLRDNRFLLDEIGQRLDNLPSIDAHERAHYYLLYAKTLYTELGESERSIDVLLRAKAVLEEEGTDTIHVYREVLTQLGEIYLTLGHYYEAFNCYNSIIDFSYTSVDLHAQRIAELGMNESEYIDAVVNMANYFIIIGDDQRANYAFGVAWGLQTRFGKEHTLSVPYLVYCMRTNQMDKCLRLFEQTFDAEYDNANSDLEWFTAHTIYAFVLLLTEGHIEEAEQQLNLALEQGVMESLPADHLVVFLYAYARAIVDYQHGDLAAAESQLKHIVATAEASDNVNLAYLTKCYADLLQLHQQLGNMEESAEDIKHCTACATELIRTTFRSMNYAERAAFWSRYAEWYTVTLPTAAYRMQRAEIDNLLYDATLMSKGLLLNSEIEVKRLVTEAKNPAATALYDSLQSLYAERKKLTNDSEAYSQLSSRTEAGERDLVNLVKSYGDYTRNLTLSWRDVQKQLSLNEAAVEFILSPLSNDSLMYSALVLKAGSNPKRVNLCSQSQLTAIPADSLYTTAELANLLWEPLIQELGDVKNVYFAPQGLLYSTAIEYAPTSDGEYISDKYSLYRLSSTREIVLPHNQKEEKSAVLYGGLNYNADTTAVVKANLDQADSNVFKPRATLEDMRGITHGISDLAYTLEEVEEIEKLHSSAHEDCHSFKGIYGTEESFKKLSGTGKTLLHLATHGFYYTQTDYNSQSFLKQAIGLLDENMISTEDKMLTKSGLFLTGANAALTKQNIPATMEDGILTAQEIATLDFRDVDLVVLSACKSAMGELSGDGVFGLQRGFKKAGAKTLLMSLWNVDDKATKLLMTAFYKNWLGADGKGGNMTKREAFLKAQDELRKTDDKYKDPKYWAAFVLLDGIN